MEFEAITKRISDDMRARFANEGSGHDWMHIERVWNNALAIATAEGADIHLVSLGALLHDIADHKFYNNDLTEGPRQAFEAIIKHGGDAVLAHKVSDIVGQVSYKGAGVPTPVHSLEAAVVQDADRLDAIGAIGIARAFAYGGSKGRLLYDPSSAPVSHADFQSYATDKGPTINHFYQKLLLLKDRMNTATARRMAVERHAFMETFLTQFSREWHLSK